MRTHPSQFPIFVYGTLKKDGLYHNRIADEIESSQEATTSGRLYYKKFQPKIEKSTDMVEPESKPKPDVTAAFTPIGHGTIQGTLLFPYEIEYYNILSKLDELEFNFDFPDLRGDGHPAALGGQHRLRVYLRDLISCTTESGASYLSWCYIYHPIISIPKGNLIPPENGLTIFDKVMATQLLNSGKIADDYFMPCRSEQSEG